MDLSTFIEKVGDERASKLFKVSRRTAQSWRLRERLPRPKQVPKIIKGSGGELSYESIYGPTPRQRAADPRPAP